MNNSITIVAIEERKELIIDVGENLEPRAKRCTYRVPTDLRQINEEAYPPRVISIGPLQHGKDELADKEKKKIRYKREYCKRITPEKWQQVIKFIEENEKKFRNSYEENSTLEKLEFITMILYDVVFIVELFLKKYRNESTGKGYPSFIFLSSLFLSQGKSDDEISVEVAIEVKHLTDLGRYFVTIKYLDPQSRECIRDLPCAVKLQESGVKFNGTEGECILDVRFVKKKLRIPFLKFDELQIPRIECHYPDKTLVPNYSDLMDIPIDTEEDVNLLVEAGITSNNMGERARIAKIHYDSPWNHGKANLKRVHFTNLWRGTGTVAAIMLILLTLIQTILLRTAQFASPIAHNFGLESQHKAKSASLAQFRNILGNSST
ncbi:hypothetical protein KPL71_018717 [Citrus sinensis]|uniref:Uncharacterized protein n=1 Tax=Citrus sinensis TaxID=2711 RepID=A0ACB8K0R4_CITSI|nr:hypothetical protein KPL71_018717 [Citrus sinensis]